MSRRVGLVLGVTATVLVTGMVAIHTDTSDSPVGPSEAAQLSSSAPAKPPSPSPEPAVLLPNMRSLGAGDLSIEADRDPRQLRFAASLGNLGPGPMVVRPRRRAGDCPPGQLQAVQLVHEDRNGNHSFERKRDTVRQRRPAGCMLDHVGHDHWHFDAMAAYSLRRAGSGKPLVSRNKVSFCLRDNERVPDQPAEVRRVYNGECTPSGPQGISPGWADVYKSHLDGQWLRLPRGIQDEVLCLDLEADPLDLLEEADEGDNATSVALRVKGTQVRRADKHLCE